MTVQAAKVTCVSSGEHGENVQDHIRHYLGCLEFCDRQEYYDGLRKELRDSIDKELSRVAYVRKVLEKDSDESRLHQCLKRSMENWRKSNLYENKDGLVAVQEWRTSKGRTNHVEPIEKDPGDRDPRKYEVDSDIKAHLIRFESSKPAENLEANSGFEGTFPNHKISVSALLNDSNDQRPSPLKKTEKKYVINYFHLPANNMIVSCTMLGLPSAVTHELCLTAYSGLRLATPLNQTEPFVGHQLTAHGNSRKRSRDISARKTLTSMQSFETVTKTRGQKRTWC